MEYNNRYTETHRTHTHYDKEKRKEKKEHNQKHTGKPSKVRDRHQTSDNIDLGY